MNTKVSKTKTKKSVLRPSYSPKTREIQMISMAQELAAKKLADGTASSQLIVHYLREGSESRELENEKLKNENELLKAKVKALESNAKTEELYSAALEAMKNYSGRTDE